MKKRITIKLLMIFALIGIMGSKTLIAQEKQLSMVRIEGQILDENALPKSKVEVKAFLSKDISITNNEGNFEILVASNQLDQLTIDEKGYELAVVPILNGKSPAEPIKLNKIIIIKGENIVELPYKSVENKRNVSSIYTITGEELTSYPTTSFMEALSGLLPGVTVTPWSSQPGVEEDAVTVAIRGESAVVYVDGVIRDPSDLSPLEVDKVQVIKDLSGRAALGIYGSSPVIWITTKKGQSFNRKTTFSAEYGMSMPTTVPEYVDASDYATLYNQALVNDGFDPYYSDKAIQAYKNNSDPINYPNINYLDKYVRPSSPFRKANINFSGGDEKVNYFSMISYAGTEGLEAIGEKIKSDRFKLRGNVNIKFNDFISMNVNISGTYKTGRGPNMQNDIFTTIAELPANAHPISFNNKLIISDDYPLNLDNELLYSGFRVNSTLSTQNNASLLFDLSKLTSGLSATASVAFDGSSQAINYKDKSASLYRLVQNPSGTDTTELVQQESIQNDLLLYNSTITRKTVAHLSFNYDRTIGKHAIMANATYYQGEFDQNRSSSEYQPEKIQDASLRAGYTYDNKYVIQADLVYSGSMRLPKGDRFSLYPTIGAGWIASNESFLKDSKIINFLKIDASLGIMGINEFGMAGYNSYYLYQTLWQTNGTWYSGIPGKFATPQNIYVIKQEGSLKYSLPKNRYLNIGLESSLFKNSLAFEINYYRENNYDLISQKQSYTPSIFGSGGFLPATNFGENMRWGFDGMIQYTKEIKDFTFSAGVNAIYSRGKYITVDEPLLEADYRKYAGKDMDEFMLYNSEGLFQSQAEIDSRNIYQTFGDVKPGDIKYTDYNNDGIIDEKDQYATGAHTARLNFGANLSVEFKGFKLKLVGQGATDGQMLISGNTFSILGSPLHYDGTMRLSDAIKSIGDYKIDLANNYFSGTGTKQNFSKAMLDSWSSSNTNGTMPRLTATSLNNMQRSTFWLVDATYFRLKNVEFSYTLPKKISRNMLMSNSTFFFRGSNLFESSSLSKYGLDPENLRAGISTYPVFKTFTFGITCIF